MSGKTALRNIYKYTKDLGLIDNIPNINNTQKDLEYFIGIQNTVYNVLSASSNKRIKKNQLSAMDIFSNDQIDYVLANQQKIRYPFDLAKKNTIDMNKKITIQDGGSLFEIPQIKIASFQDLIDAIKAKMLSMGSLLPTERIVAMLERFGISPETFQVIQGLSQLKPEDFKDIIGTLGFKVPETPTITMTDWLFFPLWSAENLPYLGPALGMPIDLMSVMVAQLDIMLATLVDTLDNFREPAIQAATSAIGVASAGVGLAAAPFIVPVVNRFFDIVIHLIAHLGTILNIFINISRKNFGLAYVLFCEVVPIFETFVNILINYMVILNRFLNRSNQFIDIYISFLTNLERVIYMSHPENLLRIKDDFLRKIQEKLVSKLPTQIIQKPT